MTKGLSIFLHTFVSLFRTRRDLAFENLLLHQQLAVLTEKGTRPQLSSADRSFWVLVSKLWPKWQGDLHIVRPETVIRWHREGFRRHWARKCRREGRPGLDPEIRLLIQQMSHDNPLWGAPRIHGELLKLGFDVSETTVSKYLIRNGKPPSQTWRTFLESHAKDIIATDFFTIPTATFRVLFVLVVLSHDRREIVHTNVTESPTAEWTARQVIEAVGLDKFPKYLVRDRDRKFSAFFSRQVASVGLREVLTAPASPWQNAYAERVIGTIRRECLDHTIILGERHLRRTVQRYVKYYNEVRMALLGFLSLMGMLIKNAIVLVDEINIQSLEDKPAIDAIIGSAVSRLRPVAMAAATTILGMAPLFPDAFFVSMAVTISFGLGFATILTMIIVPVLYATIYKIRAN